MTTSIKVPDELRDRIANRAREHHQSQADVVADALDALERREFWISVREGYARLREDDDAWNEYRQERDEWVDAGLVDDRE